MTNMIVYLIGTLLVVSGLAVRRFPFRSQSGLDPLRARDHRLASLAGHCQNSPKGSSLLITGTGHSGVSSSRRHQQARNASVPGKA